MRLTPKQKLFVKEYLKDFNATQAALRAGYSPRTARAIGQENLTKPAIQKAIEKSRNNLSNRLQAADITIERIAEQLAKIAFSDIKDFVEFGEEVDRVLLDPETGEEIEIMKPTIRVKHSKDVDGTILSEVSETRDGLKIKRPDQVKALELLGRWKSMFSDNINVNKGVPISEVLDDDDDPEGN